ncbi:MAG: alpha/beta hydrolase [Alphaproteobacteria bacterium]|nr:alpha/beta hydrolase [Alphaproteobacteria bacterium]
MYRYFKDNFAWSFSVSLAMEMGQINEIDQACAPLLALQSKSAKVMAEAWHKSWTKIGDKVAGQGRDDARNGHDYTAGMKLLRACGYYQIAERLMVPADPRRNPLYQTSIDCFSEGVALSGHRTTRVEIPVDGGIMAGWLTLPDGPGPHPCLIFSNGFDSTKEILYLIHRDLSCQRGIATFFVDNEGSGEALRFHNMKLKPETEVWAGKCVDYLETVAQIDSERIGIMALSFGGYSAPRAAAFEPRLKCCIALGANPVGDKINPVDFEARLSTPEIESHSLWLTGAKSRQEAWEIFDAYTLTDALPALKCPFLVAHGELDLLVPMTDAQWMVDLAVNSSRAELRKFTEEEGAAEHCGADDPKRIGAFCYDWAAEVLGGRTKPEKPS